MSKSRVLSTLDKVTACIKTNHDLFMQEFIEQDTLVFQSIQFMSSRKSCVVAVDDKGEKVCVYVHTPRLLLWAEEQSAPDYVK